MKKIRFYPKLFINHLKKRPSRIVTWFSILAILTSVIVTILNPKIFVPKAKAGITISGNDLTLAGASGTYIDCIFVDSAGNIQTIAGHCEANQYIIDVDGYILVRYIPDTSRSFGFEYVYYYDQNTKQRARITSNSNLIIDGNGVHNGTTVYMEGSKSNALVMNNLEVKNGAVLSQVPAHASGLNVPFSTGNYWGVQMMGYYYLGPLREVSFSIKGNSNTSSSYLQVGNYTADGLRFDKISNQPLSSLGYRYQIVTDPAKSGGNVCAADANNEWCSNPGNGSDEAGRWRFQNLTAQSQYLAFMYNAAVDNSVSNSKEANTLRISHWEREIDAAGNVIKDITAQHDEPIPMEKFVGLADDGTPAITNPGINSNFGPSQNIAFAYYFNEYGHVNNHQSMNAIGINHERPRSFQILDKNISEIPGFNASKTTTYDGVLRHNFLQFEYKESGQDADYPNNPLSRSIWQEGLDYLRAPLYDYVMTTLVGENGRQREARINIEAKNINLSDGIINVTGKGYPGGMAGFSADDTWDVGGNYTHPIGSNSIQYPGYADNPGNGAGYGGGKGATSDNPWSGCSGSYGGNAATVNYGADDIIDTTTHNYNVTCGHTYGGRNIMAPQDLGSGGGYYDNSAHGDNSTSIGGSGGGAIHLKADLVTIDSFSDINANGGNGFFTPPFHAVVSSWSNYYDPVSTQGTLGKPGYPAQESKYSYSDPIDDNNYLWDEQARGTAGSGGSIFIEANQFDNQGRVNARGVYGAARWLKTQDPTKISQEYDRDYNSDQYFNCMESNKTHCAGAPSSGGRIAIIYDNEIHQGTIRAWGGGWTTAGDHNDVQLMTIGGSSDVVVSTAGDGTVVYQKSSNANVYNKTISIDKSVNLCLLDNCADGPTDPDANPDIDQNNSTASNGAWMLVRIKLTNNTGQDQNNISLTDDKFYNSTGWTPILPDPNFDSATDPAEIKWDGISIPNGAPEKILEYKFVISF